MKFQMLSLILLWIFAAMFSFSGFTQSTVQIGTGTSTGQRIPIEPAYDYTYAQVIYLQSEISTAGDITHLKWYFYGSSLSNSNNWDIYIGHTTKTAFASTSDWIAVSSLTQVWSGTFADPEGSGWITFDISDFSYNNTDNLVIAVDENAANDNGFSDDFYCTSVANYRGLSEYGSTNINPASPPSGSRKKYIANIILEFGNTACPAPTNLTVTNISQTSADLSWTENGTATTWDIEYGATGYTQGTGTTITGVTNPYTLSGIPSATTYDWYVRASCGGSGVSTWAGLNTFSTLCNTVTTYPWTEDFENNGVFPPCWSQEYISGTHDWIFHTGGYNNSNPSTAHGGTYNACFSPTNTGTKTNLVTPQFDLSGQSNPQLSFWHTQAVWDGDQDELRVYYKTTSGGTWILIPGAVFISSITSWTQETFNLPSPSSTYYIEFEGLDGYGYGICVDDVQISVSSCPTPTSLFADNISQTTVDLNWTTGGATTWNIEWGATGFTQGAGTMITGTTTNPYSLSGLTAGLTYDFYVQDDCGGTTSSWTGPSSFTTLCNAITSFPFTEDFENAGSRPDCWTEEYNVGSHDWAFQDGGDTDPISAHGGSYNAIFMHQSSGSSTKLITPELNLSSLTNPQISFWHAQVEDNGDQDELRVYYKTSQGGSWTLIPGATYTSNVSAWTQRTLSLPSANATYFVAFEGTDGYGQGVCIDDVVVDGTISCLPPTDLYVNDITTTSAKLNWTTGGATTWNIEWGAKDFVQGTGTMIIGTTTNPHSLSGLTANTLYDFYVQDDCGGSQSTWTGPQTFCAAINSFPWTEDFENAGNRPDCWSEEYVTGTKDWDFRTGGISSEPPNAHGGTYNASFDPGNVGYKTMLITPVFDISSFTNPELEFWHTQIAWEGDVNALRVYYKTTDGGSWVLIPGGEYTTEITVWTLELLALPSPSATYQIAFEGTDNGGLSICIDDVTIKECCCDPSNQTEGNFTTTSADLDWTENGSATTWDIKRGVENIGFNYALLNENVAKPCTWSGLTEGDTYDWWVRSNCGANGYSEWVGLSEFTIPCESRSLPWEEGFESMVFVANQVVPTCMEIDVPNEWTTNDQNLTYNRMAHTGTNSIYNNGNDHPNDWLFSVPFDLVAGASYDFSFWYITSGGQSWDFEAKYGTGQTTGEMTVAIGTTQTNVNNTAYQRFRESFSVTTSGTYYVSIHTWIGGQYNSYITFDDLLVEETPSCYPPMDQSTSDYTNTTAILNWTEDGSATIWDVEYGPAGFNQGTGTTVTGITAKPYTLTNLTENTVYDWYVRADCGGDASDWTGPDIFSTSITSFPYTESFEDAVAPNCWNITEVYYDGSGYRPEWSQVNMGGAIPPNWSSGDDKVAFFNSSQCSNGDKARLETPDFDMDGYSSMFLSFWMYHDDGSSSYDDNIQLQVKINNGAWQSFGNPISRYSTSDGWSKHTIDLSAYCGDNITLGFLATSRLGYYMKIDKVTIHNSAPAAANWTGTTGNNWYDASNWSTSDISYSITNVNIPEGLTNYPTISTRGGECNNITLKSSAAGDASLLDNGYLSINGDAAVERYITGGVWHDISASVNNATVYSLYFNGNPDVWLRTYNEPDNTKTYVTQLTTPMHSGQGFEVWVETGSDVTGEFVGPLQTADLTLNSTSTPPLSYSGPDPLGFNLIGNPFTSPLDWDMGSWNETDMAGTVWVWDDVSGNYKTRNSAGAGDLTDGIIPMGQGFFVQATATTASIAIPMDARVHSAQAYYKNTRGTSNAPPHIVITVNKEMRSDGIWLTFAEEDTDGFDIGHDVREMTGSDNAPQLYLVEGDEQYCIDALPQLNGETRLVPMHFEAGSDGVHILEISDLDHLPETDILLEDLETGDIQNLRKFPAYEFEAWINEDPNRFLIHFNPITTQINDSEINHMTSIYAWGNEIYIVRADENISENGVVHIYDLWGCIVHESMLQPQSINRIRLKKGSAYYVVRVVVDGTAINKKVYVRAMVR